jgi:hypothetical protein
MSAIASFILIPKSSLPELRSAAVPKKAWFGGTKDRFHDFLRQRGREVSRYDWSGYVIATLLVYLQQRKGIDLMKAQGDDVSPFLIEKRKGTWITLDASQKVSHLTQLAPESYSETELRDFYNEFNASNETEIGKAMLDGIRSIGESLGAVDSDSIVLLNIA